MNKSSAASLFERETGLRVLFTFRAKARNGASVVRIADGSCDRILDFALHSDARGNGRDPRKFYRPFAFGAKIDRACLGLHAESFEAVAGEVGLKDDVSLRTEDIFKTSVSVM